MFWLSLVLYLSQVCLQPLSKVPGSRSSGGLGCVLVAILDPSTWGFFKARGLTNNHTDIASEQLEVQDWTIIHFTSLWFFTFSKACQHMLTCSASQRGITHGVERATKWFLQFLSTVRFCDLCDLQGESGCRVEKCSSPQGCCWGIEGGNVQKDQKNLEEPLSGASKGEGGSREHSELGIRMRTATPKGKESWAKVSCQPTAVVRSRMKTENCPDDLEINLCVHLWET
jgi:hypothetical protein